MALSVLEVGSDVITELSGKRGLIVRTAAIPVLVLIGLNAALYFPDVPVPLSTIASIGGLIVYALIAVNCHRLVLLGPNSLASRWGLRVSGHVIRYGLWILGMAFIALLAALPIALILIPVLLMSHGADSAQPVWPQFIFALMVALPVSYLVARISPILPARALGETTTLSEIWDLSDGVSITLWVILTVPTVVFSGLSVLLVELLGGEASPAASLIADLLYAPLIIVQIVILSCTYRELVRVPESGDDIPESDHVAA